MNANLHLLRNYYSKFSNNKKSLYFQIIQAFLVSYRFTSSLSTLKVLLHKILIINEITNLLHWWDKESYKWISLAIKTAIHSNLKQFSTQHYLMSNITPMQKVPMEMSTKLEKITGKHHSCCVIQWITIADLAKHPKKSFWIKKTSAFCSVFIQLKTTRSLIWRRKTIHPVIPENHQKGGTSANGHLA